MPQLNSRALAAKVLVDVLYQSRSLADALPFYLAKQPKLKDANLVKALCYGLLRHYYSLSASLKPFMKKALRNKEGDVELLLLLGLYQLTHLSIPPGLVLDETAEAAKQLGKKWATGLVNAVLRQFLRQNSDTKILTNLTVENKKPFTEQEYNHPLWLMQKVKTAWPENYDQILIANQAHPPMTLRVNESKITRAAYQALLTEKGIVAEEHAFIASVLILNQPISVEKLPGFHQGLVSVQDLASQLAAFLLDCPPGVTVLDACAAPGGKTCHLLEHWPEIKTLTALDISAERLQKIKENLTRLNLQAQLVLGDAGEPETWWQQELFDRILCDAPCSATGVIRRHPDIKFLRQPEDMIALVRQQLTILTKLWALLKPGGKLLYSTCAIFPEENTQVIAQFLEQETTSKTVALPDTFGYTQAFGRQILPGQDNMDGFYYALLEKSI